MDLVPKPIAHASHGRGANTSPRTPALAEPRADLRMTSPCFQTGDRFARRLSPVSCRLSQAQSLAALSPNSIPFVGERQGFGFEPHIPKGFTSNPQGREDLGYAGLGGFAKQCPGVGRVFQKAGGEFAAFTQRPVLRRGPLFGVDSNKHPTIYGSGSDGGDRLSMRRYSGQILRLNGDQT